MSILHVDVAKSGTYRTSHVQVFVRSLRLPIIFTRQGGHPVDIGRSNSLVIIFLLLCD